MSAELGIMFFRGFAWLLFSVTQRKRSFQKINRLLVTQLTNDVLVGEHARKRLCLFQWICLLPINPDTKLTLLQVVFVMSGGFGFQRELQYRCTIHEEILHRSDGAPNNTTPDIATPSDKRTRGHRATTS